MRLLLCLPALLLGACRSTPPADAPLPDQTIRIPGTAGGTPRSMTISRTTSPWVRTVRAPVDRVWERLPAVYQTIGIPVTDRDVAARTIGNAGYKVRRRVGDVALSRYLDCGSAQGHPSADTYEVVLTMMTRVQPSAADSAASSVSTTVTALARPLAFSADYITCSTRGVLEKRFFDALEIETRG